MGGDDNAAGAGASTGNVAMAAAAGVPNWTAEQWQLLHTI